ncbi:MAG: hypothetical protein LHW48_00740 [Candidatus Cloacimonetes bacterium]|nr:hypothetical protein [Candidatus Cloacimonadota bacterium]
MSLLEVIPEGILKRIAVLIPLVLTVFTSFCVETKNRFSAYLHNESELYTTGMQWAMDFAVEEDIGAVNFSGQYSQHSHFISRWHQQDHSISMYSKPYRWWLRMQIPQSELRAGLQQINFGSAQILRPLKWFDSLDPQDPLKLSGAVEALLIRHHWLNNANFWLWAMMGEEELKGNELLCSKQEALEFGGRVQYPVLWGDTALSFHYRPLLWGKEYRMGLDLRMDDVIGAWLELNASYYKAVPNFPTYQTAITLGGDYVLDWQNGIAITMENMLLASAQNELYSAQSQNWVSTLMLNYPLSIIDTISLLALAEWQTENHSMSLAWLREYDYLSLHFLLVNSKETDFGARLMLSMNL